MAKKKNKEKSISFKYIIPAFIMIFVVVSVLGSYGFKLIQDARKDVEDSYAIVASNVAAQYEREIYAVSEISKVYADFAKDADDLFADENIHALNAVVDNLSVSNAYLVKADYTAIDTKGNSFEMITQLPGYDDAFKGTNTVTKFIMNANGEDVMLICTPVNTKTEMKGYVLLEYIPNVMDTLLQSVRFSPQNCYGLMSTSGKVLEVAGANSALVQAGADILDLSAVTVVQGSQTTLKQTVIKMRRDNFIMSKGGKTEYLFMCPVNNYEAEVVLAVGDKIVKASIEKQSKNIKNMLMSIGVIIGIFLLLILVIDVFTKAKFSLESEDLQNKADTDQLTDLYNKMATERLIKEYLEGDGKDRVSMLFLLDIDNFKKINDTMGHAFGDEVLSNLGHQIRSWFRVNDIVGRIGGDEFMVFIKDIKDQEVVKREGSRIMQFFEGFQVGDYTKYSPTASIGGAVYPDNAKDFESLYKAADKAVYKAKKEGKNRVAFYSDLDKTEQETEPDKTGRD